MRFLLDENVDVRLRAFLSADGHDVTQIGIDYPASLTDEAVLAQGLTEARIVITNDRDFGELVFRRGLMHGGVVYLRLRLTLPEHVAQRLRHTLTTYSDRLSEFIVVTDRQVRFAL